MELMPQPGSPPVKSETPPAFRVLTVVPRATDEKELPDIYDAWSLADGLAAVEVPAEV